MNSHLYNGISYYYNLPNLDGLITNTLKYFVIQMGPLLSFRLLLAVIGTTLFDLSYVCLYSSNKRPVALLPMAPVLTSFPLH